MARRMFTEKITRSDAFLDMPTSTQALYFHLLSDADDDGFVSSPKMVMRIVGATSDEIVLLVNKKFIIPFNNGICVIKHWRIHNQVRKDRYEETKYKKEKESLFIRENGAYTTNYVNAIPVPSGYFSMENIEEQFLATNWQPVGALGKGSIGKVNTATPSEIADTNKEEKITNTNTQKKDMAWKEYEEKEIQIDEDYLEKEDKKEIKDISSQKKVKTIYELFSKYDFDVSMLGINKSQRKAAETLFDTQELEQVEKAIEFYSKRKKDEFCPDVSTPWDLASKWTKLLAYKEKTQ